MWLLHAGAVGKTAAAAAAAGGIFGILGGGRDAGAPNNQAVERKSGRRSGRSKSGGRGISSTHASVCVCGYYVIGLIAPTDAATVLISDLNSTFERGRIRGRAAVLPGSLFGVSDFKELF